MINLNMSQKKLFLFFIAAAFFYSCSFAGIQYPPDARDTQYDEIKVYFIDVGQGDSSLVLFPDGKNILIDTGSPAGGPLIAGFLKSLGIRKIDHLITTHPHDDHFGGIFSILAEFDVKKFYDNGFCNFNSTMYGEYVRYVRKDLADYTILQAGEVLVINSMRIEVLNPLLPPAENSNDDSIVLKAVYGDVGILFAGDLGKTGERRLLKNGADTGCQILKAGHHGENDTGSREFLEAAGPETIIVSAAKINKYARPHRELLKRLEQTGADVFRTDIHGHITLKSNGTTYSVSTEK